MLIRCEINSIKFGDTTYYNRVINTDNIEVIDKFDGEREIPMGVYSIRFTAAHKRDKQYDWKFDSKELRDNCFENLLDQVHTVKCYSTNGLPQF